jgi:Family of unknown function (DUF5343)
MADVQLPYVTGYGNITKALQKIQTAQTPPRFTQDFLATKLALKGGSARPVIPFLKRTGFLASDGTPTSLYNRFRNSAQRGTAAAEALRRGYAPLYEVNEYAHDLTDRELKGLVVQVTGLQESSSTFKAIIGSFNALKAFADFAAALEPVATDERAVEAREQPAALPAVALAPAAPRARTAVEGINLGYTINLHLPATSDIAVFDAIFKSLGEHLLQ